jgi:hypothetical protein
VARVALGDRRGIRALKEAVSFVSPRPRQSDDGEQRLTIERARKAYYDMLERSNKDNEITAWLTDFSETVLTAQQNTLKRLEFYLAKTRLYDRLRGKLNERQEKVLARIFRERIDGFEGGLSAENYVSVIQATRATATRDLQNLVKKGALVSSGRLRHTRYHLNIPGQILEGLDGAKPRRRVRQAARRRAAERLVMLMQVPRVVNSHSISGLNILRNLPVLVPEIMNTPSPR